MSLLGKLFVGGVGFAIGSQLKPETRELVVKAAKAVGDDLTRRLREEATKVGKFVKEEVLAEGGPQSEPPSPEKAPPASAPAPTPAQA